MDGIKGAIRTAKSDEDFKKIDEQIADLKKSTKSVVEGLCGDSADVKDKVLSKVTDDGGLNFLADSKTCVYGRYYTSADPKKAEKSQKLSDWLSGSMSKEMIDKIFSDEYGKILDELVGKSEELGKEVQEMAAESEKSEATTGTEDDATNENPEPSKTDNVKNKLDNTKRALNYHMFIGRCVMFLSGINMHETQVLMRLGKSASVICKRLSGDKSKDKDKPGDKNDVAAELG